MMESHLSGTVRTQTAELPASDFELAFRTLRASRERLAAADARERRHRLRRLRDAIERRHDDILTALREDVGRPAAEAEFAEFNHVLLELDLAIRKVPRWMRPRRARNPLLLWGTSARIIPEPRGVVLILAPWNYPFALCINPLIAAMAAGNAVLLKPSEKAPATSSVLAQLVSEGCDEREVVVVEGGVDVARRLLELPFDHFFFTGGSEIGRIVMQAAALHLAPVTLELGGKSPAIVDATANVPAAARRILWGRYFNAGQTCISPDYALVQRTVAEAFLAESRAAADELYGRSDEERRRSNDFGRIVDDAHWSRLDVLLDESIAEGARVVIGGNRDRETRYFAPTVVADIDAHSPLMREEIFGPILPVITFDTLEDVKRITRTFEVPLASYVFSHNRDNVRRFIREIPAGGTTINNVLLHYASFGLPFGGVGASGIGRYHGEYGFRELSHERAVLHQGWPDLSPMLFPPYRGRIHRLVRAVTRRLRR